MAYSSQPGINCSITSVMVDEDGFSMAGEVMNQVPGDCCSGLSQDRVVTDEAVTIGSDTWYWIRNVDAMRPFMMSVVSASDHWLFAASTGAVTAGRVSPDVALFAYDTEDKLAERGENTGGKTMLRVKRDDGPWQLWEPWSDRYRGVYVIERSLAKHAFGDEVIFEEKNIDLGLTIRISWRTGDRFGFMRLVEVVNDGGNCQIEVLDGLQNVLPAGTNWDLQKNLSVLVDAYKRHELDVESGLALYRMTASLTAQAKPCAALRANVVWHAGIEPSEVLLCAAQMDQFRDGTEIRTETDVRGRRGAYWVKGEYQLAAGESCDWMLCGDVAQDHSQVINLIDLLKETDASKRMQMLREDIQENRRKLRHIVAAADGLQCTGDKAATGHHFANTLFNVMRGGVFADGYNVQRDDLQKYLASHNRQLAARVKEWLASLPDVINIQQLREKAAEHGDRDLMRLVGQYMPLTFSRRHGGPTRPWNFFNIRLHNEDGSERLDYQGNWRDIFQNWEALLLSYPEFLDNAINVFLNATSFDGYNPCAISRDEIHWHRADQKDPTRKVGHSGDHQLIYLLKLLEMQRRVKPGALAEGLDKARYAYSRIPYRIRPTRDILINPFDSIEFDFDLDEKISREAAELGNDGRLWCDDEGRLRWGSLLEKLLTLVLAKLGNFVAGGGIWMSTQRPEWNDGNSALSGWGLSVVTLNYLHRFLLFMRMLVQESGGKEYQLSAEVAKALEQMMMVLKKYHHMLDGEIDDGDRLRLLEELGGAHSDFRKRYYDNTVSEERVKIDRQALVEFLDEAISHCKRSVLLNRRDDGLYHSYNVLRLGDGAAKVGWLYEMLEGQVAVLSSGCIDDEEALRVLAAMRKSDFYAQDRASYMLNPEKVLPRFLDINRLPDDAVKRAPLLRSLVEAGNRQLVTRDGRGGLHFAGSFYNDDDVKMQLAKLSRDSRFAEMVERDGQAVLELFEEVFDHHSFIGRSGVMYGYEGLGCIYWHMVSKLLVAVQERAQAAGSDKARQAFRDAYEHVRDGLGFRRGADKYGAFATDPYSHTRSEGGARQPGMTGQVKEELLTRMDEMGLWVCNGELHFGGALLLDEGLVDDTVFDYVDVKDCDRQLQLKVGEQSLTLCQVPIVVSRGENSCITVEMSDGQTQAVDGAVLNCDMTTEMFGRSGKVVMLRVKICSGWLADFKDCPIE